MAGASIVIGKILQGAGTTLGLYGQYQDKLSVSKKQAFDAQVAANNAELARQDIDVRQAGGRQERSSISKGEHVTRGEARVGSAAGNVAVGEGSALEVDIALAEQAARERSASRDQEAVDVKRLETERDTLLAESRLLRKAARRTKKSARMGFIGGNLQAIGSSISK